MFVDSHCHLNYLTDPVQAWQRAQSNDVATALCIGVEESAITEVLTLARELPGVWASVGEHPGSCSGDATWVQQHLNAPRVVAVGEMGLDYHYEKDPKKQALQRHTFAQQLEIAQQHNLPVIIHTRTAQADTLALMREFPGVIGVMHCFTESWDMAKQALDMGYFVSISGIVTFKNAAQVREVASQVPADRLLIETDAPWLAPVPHRGHKNEPAWVTHTAACVADLRGVSVEELAATTRQNFFLLFDRAA